MSDSPVCPGRPRDRHLALADGPGGVLLLALVLVLVAGSIRLDRGRHEPVAGFGIVPQPGAITAAPPGSGLAVGALAPNFRLRATDGEIVELAGRRGQPVLIHFWTTWCLACASEIPIVQDLAETHAGRLHVLGIDVGEGAGRVEDAAEVHDTSYPMLLDRDEEVASAYGVREYPVTLLIDANGAIAVIASGPVGEGDLDRQLDAVLGN